MRNDFLGDKSFIRNLFNAIPCGILVFDKNRQVRQINHVLEQLLGTSSQAIDGKRGGDILNCVHASEASEGCGTTKYCKRCDVRKAADEALAGHKTSGACGSFHFSREGKTYDVSLLLSAAPFEHHGELFAVVIIEDVSKLDVSLEMETAGACSNILGHHPKVKELHRLLHEAALVALPVLIQGETGTGKELAAQAIHNAGSRRNKPFIPVNCGALPHGLLESELFGHVKGAFTGAIRDKKGRFELADGGTIFLDEIGELAPAVQVKLLRVLQEGSFERIGGIDTVKVDVRVISATNKNLEEEVAAGRFRLDLFYRLCVVPVIAPPLRERIKDIPLLVEHFLSKYGKHFGKRKPLSISPQALAILKEYSWPGNIRELQNVIQYSLMKCKGQGIEPSHFPAYILKRVQPDKSEQAARSTGKFRKRKLDEQTVIEVLRKAEGNKAEAAKILGVARASLYRFIRENMD